MEASKHSQMRSLRDGQKRERERDEIVGLRKINEIGKDKAGKDMEMLVCEKKSHL